MGEPKFIATAADVNELVGRINNLTAEIASLKKEKRWSYENAAQAAALAKENEALKGEVARLKAPKPQPTWDGTNIPPVGADVLFKHSNDRDVVGTVTRYETWGSLGGSPYDKRILIHLVYKGTNITNARHLCEIRPITENTKCPEVSPGAA